MFGFDFRMFQISIFSVGRFVKHTGYGNAAGLLARRGLMLGGQSSNVYSSSSEDSDTDDYVEKSHLYSTYRLQKVATISLPRVFLFQSQPDHRLHGPEREGQPF